MTISILIADRQDMFREALRRLLESQRDFSVLGDTDDGEKLVKLIQKHKPDVILLDLKLLKQNAIEVLKQVSALKIDVRPILLTDTIEKSSIISALLSGARGVLLKSESGDLLFKSIRTVMRGEYWVSRNGIRDLVRNLRSMSLLVARNAQIQSRNLSRQQQQIVEAIISGYSNKEIAQELSVTERTVKYHVTCIFRKYGVSSRMELLRHTHSNSFASALQ